MTVQQKIAAAKMKRDAKRRVATTEELKDGGVPGLPHNGGSVWHETDSMVLLYKPTDEGYRARYVPISNISMCLEGGWLEKCPDCGGTCGIGENACKGREPVPYLVCPIQGCNGDRHLGAPSPKRIYATRAMLRATAAPEDPAALPNPYAKVTIASQLKARLDRHILACHQEEARALGLIEPPKSEVPGL